jgi:hypothetical protein
MKREPDNQNSWKTSESEVGYRRPPVATRFKPGQSGNPKGRKKERQNLPTMFNNILNEQVTLRENSRTRKVPKAEAIVRGIIVNAMKGDQKAIVTIFKIAEQTGQLKDVAEKIVVSWKAAPDE